MAAITLVAVLFAVGLVMFFRQWRSGRGSSQFVLGSLPIALLFFTAPIPGSMWQVIQGFSRIAEDGIGGLTSVVPLCLTIARPLQFGALCAIVGLGAAAAMQVTVSASDRRSVLAPEIPVPSRAGWQLWALVGASTLVVPVLFLSQFTQAIPRRVMSAVDTVSAHRATDGLGDISQAIASRIMIAMLAGGTVSVFLILAAITSLVAMRGEKTLDFLAKYSWAVLAIVGLFAAWTAVTMTGDIRSFERALR